MSERRTTSMFFRAIVEITIVAVAVGIGFQIWGGDSDPADDASDPGETGDAVTDAPGLERLGMREEPTALRERPGWTTPRKAVVLDLWPGRTGDLADAAPDLDIVVVDGEAAALEAIEGADALLGALTPRLLEAGRDLRWVQLASAGVESYLAMPGLEDRDLTITNAQRIFAPGGAEHVLALTLALARRLPKAIELQDEGMWDPAPITGPAPYVGAGSELVELRGRTMLVAGLGGIGTETARLAHGIGMRVIATRASSRSGPPFVDYVGLSEELADLAGEAHVVVNALPLTASTRGIFDKEVFGAMQPGATFVNIGRGGTVETAALVEALRSGRLAGAGLDVVEPEPLPADHELRSLPNVIITPHVGGDSDRHMDRMFQLFDENLRRFAAGDRLLSVVDPRRGY